MPGPRPERRINMEKSGKASQGGPSVCVECAGAGTSCCVDRQIFVTAGDVRRISRATGESGFAVREAVSSAYAEHDDDPAWSLYVLACGERPVLVRRADGSCHFLGDGGCVLDLHTRPLLCRLYPFEFAEAGIREVDGECPASRCGDPEGAMRTMGMAPDEVADWHRQLYLEIRTAPDAGTAQAPPSR
jgi:Fe-S-cluster containining protein